MLTRFLPVGLSDFSIKKWLTPTYLLTCCNYLDYSPKTSLKLLFTSLALIGITSINSANTAANEATNNLGKQAATKTTSSSLSNTHYAQTSNTLSKAELRQGIQKILTDAPRGFHGSILVTQQNGLNYHLTQGVPELKHDSVLQIQDPSQEKVKEQAQPIQHKSLQQHQYIIGSLSKLVTAVLIMQAIDSGKLTLDQPANELLGNRVHSDVTISQLLNHTSGITNNALSLNTPAGEQFRYSNLGYQLLGNILSYIHQQPLTDVFQTFAIENQLDIRADFGTLANIQAANPVLAAPFSEQPAQPTQAVPTQQTITAEPARYERVPLNPSHFSEVELASGYLQATPEAIAQLNSLLHQGQLMSEVSYHQLITAHVRRVHRWGKLGYGFGLQISDTAFGPEYSHSGYVPGYISTQVYYPQFGVNLVILENTSWSLQDIERVFSIHDQIRHLMHSQLSSLI
ncbi:serine hydrolase domain-containing protein [Shewanella maritima]|uniref:serine hydrolase domain-containing protein n=1 Tax=Shewanella maritima TaxID=2520507 RepID=UPI00373672C0